MTQKLDEIISFLRLKNYDKKLYIIGEEKTVNYLQQHCKNVSAVISFGDDASDRLHYTNIKLDAGCYVVWFDGTPQHVIDYIKRVAVCELYSCKEFVDMLQSLKKKTCPLDNIHISATGGVYICKLLEEYFHIGDIEDEDIEQKIKNFYPANPCFCNKFRFCSATEEEKQRPLHLKRLYFEFGGACQSKCSHCFQYLQPHSRVSFKRYDALLAFAKKINHDELIVYGGEVLVQKDTLNFLHRYRENSSAKVRLNTNACVDLGMVDEIVKICDEVSITFNGFSQSTTKTIMDLDFGQAKALSEALASCGMELTLKFLASPINIHEIPAFLEWAFSLTPKRISIKVTDVYLTNEDSPLEKKGCTLEGLNMAYWRPLFKRIAAKVNGILDENRDAFGRGKIRLSLQKELISIIHIDDCHLKNIDVTLFA